MYPHRIRLRTPWEAGPVEKPRHVSVPARLRDAGWPGFSGSILLRRKFGYPGRIDAFERVWLTCAGIEGKADISLNDHLLAKGITGPFEFDVTRLLVPHNRLDVMLEANSDACGITGEVALEIRCAAYLSGVTASLLPDGHVQVRGQLLGQSQDPLDLYILVDGRNEHYAALRTTGQPTDFSAIIPFSREPLASADAAPHRIRVELVQGSVIWYRIDLHPTPT